MHENSVHSSCASTRIDLGLHNSVQYKTWQKETPLVSNNTPKIKQRQCLE